MDELIARLWRKQEAAQRLRDKHPYDSASWKIHDATSRAYSDAALSAMATKRRMAEREPAWTVGP